MLPQRLVDQRLVIAAAGLVHLPTEPVQNVGVDADCDTVLPGRGSATAPRLARWKSCSFSFLLIGVPLSSCYALYAQSTHRANGRTASETETARPSLEQKLPSACGPGRVTIQPVQECLRALRGCGSPAGRPSARRQGSHTWPSVRSLSRPRSRERPLNRGSRTRSAFTEYE